MKRAIVVVLLLALTAGAVFAELPDWISFGAWGQGHFAVIQTKTPKDGDTEAFTGEGLTWAATPRVGWSTYGSTDYVGFQFELNNDGGTVNLNDNTNLWAKPLGNDLLAIKMGKFKVDNLRGKIGNFTGDFQNYTLGTMDGEDGIFYRLESNDLNGFALYSKPIDDLFIGLRLKEIIEKNTDAQTALEDAWKKVQIGAGYNIGNIGLIRAQYVGGLNKRILDANNGEWELLTPSPAAFGNPGVPANWTQHYGVSSFDDHSYSRIEAAFALTMVENLTLDLGGKVYLPFTEDDVKYSKGGQVSLGANYTMGDLGIKGRIDTRFGGSLDDQSVSGRTYKEIKPFKFNAHLEPSYNLGFITVGLDTGVAFATASKTEISGIYTAGKETVGTTENADDTFQFGIGAWVKKDLGQGYVQLGFAVKLPEYTHNEQSSATIFSVPLIIEYWF